MESELHEFARKFLEEKNVLDFELLMVMITGSQSYNLATPSSDVDYFGVYLASKNDILGLDPPPESVSNQPLGPPPDADIYEAKKYCRLLIEGNPFAIETLFCERNIYESDSFRNLKKMRRIFLTKKAIRQYIGYVLQFMKKDFNAKNQNRRRGKRIYHMLRLLMEANRILDGLEPFLWLSEDNPIRAELVAIKAENYVRSEFEIRIKKLLEEVTHRVESTDCCLPETVDEAVVNDWLISTRRNQILQ
eukprot:TRINITY_DN4523_c0_g1_i1.p1 TRINITY_DN4523_c0_g1~~TRINITY_DN4523_c0_g1_i1.p1  ORF type:complete len:248 (-),score=48.46 TRINITY_DN4523_c0_g1_i1:26-769(-)